MGHRFDPADVDKLEDPDRLRWQPPETVVGLLQLRGDETVVDFGAGSGVYTLPLAEALPHGRVIAVDVSGELLARLREKLAAHPHLAGRIETVRSDGDGVPLAAGRADAVVAVNVWHEIADEPAVVDGLVATLVPGGRLLIVDWAQMERPVGPPPHHLLSVAQAREGVAALGLTVAAVHEPGELFPYHYVVDGRVPEDDA